MSDASKILFWITTPANTPCAAQTAGCLSSISWVTSQSLKNTNAVTVCKTWLVLQTNQFLQTKSKKTYELFQKFEF